MSKGVINIQDPIGKTVGRRRVVADSGTYGMALQALVNEVRRSQGFGAICPRGVYRFRSHEEADAWMMKAIVDRAVRVRN
jgi:phosphopantetheine adenylyltransferase